MNNKITIYFGSDKKDRTEIATLDNRADVFKTIFAYLDSKDIKYPYTRVFGDDPVVIDYGNHSKFFYVYGIKAIQLM